MPRWRVAIVVAGRYMALPAWQVSAGTLGLLVEVLADIGHDLRNALGRQQRALRVDGGHLLVADARLRPDRVDVVDAERQDVPVVDGIDDGVGVQLVAMVTVEAGNRLDYRQGLWHTFFANITAVTRGGDIRYSPLVERTGSSRCLERPEHNCS